MHEHPGQRDGAADRRQDGVHQRRRQAGDDGDQGRSGDVVGPAEAHGRQRRHDCARGHRRRAERDGGAEGHPARLSAPTSPGPPCSRIRAPNVFKFTADSAFKEAPATTHDYDQVLVALAPTTLTLDVGGKTITSLKRGEVAFIGRGQAHQAQNASGKPQELIVIAIK